MKKHSTRCLSHIQFLLLCSCLTVGVIGCSTFGSSGNYMTSFPDPAFVGKRFTFIAVHYDSPNLSYRKAVESELVDELRERKVSAVESSTIIPPTRTWDSSGIRNALLAKGIDGYIRIVEVERWTEHRYIPEKQTTQVKREAEAKKVPDTKRKYGESKRDSVTRVTETETTTTTTSGGYTQEITWWRFNVELVDLASGKVAWLGSKSICGSVSYEAENFSEKVAEQLREDGMVK